MRNPCEKFDHRLQRLLDLGREPQGDARLTRHARSCDACRRSLAGHQLLVDALEVRCAVRAEAIAPEFSRRLSAEVSQSWPKPSAVASSGAERSVAMRVVRSNRWAVVAALAAALVLMVWGARRRPVDIEVKTRQAAPTIVLREASVPGPAIGDRVPGPAIPELGSAQMAIARRASDRLTSNRRAGNDAIEAGTRRQVQRLAAETGGQLAAAARRLAGIDEAHASLEAREAPASVRGADANSVKSWTDSMSAVLELWFETLPARDQGSRS